MTGAVDGTDPAVPIAKAVHLAADELVAPGDWLEGAARRRAWVETRRARMNPFVPAQGNAHLSAGAAEVVRRVATDPGRLSRAWAEDMMVAIGESTYTELVGLVACAVTVDTYSAAIGEPQVEIGAGVAGDPTRCRPLDVGDVGAWVAQSTSPTMANVSRALSLVPVTDRTWRRLVDTMYSRGVGFLDLRWERALSRPQVELVAARTTAENECFY